MSAALIIDIILWGSVAAVGIIAFRRGRPVLVASLREGTMDFINIVPRIALGVIGSGYIAAVIPSEVITGWLGPDSGWLGVLTAVIALQRGRLVLTTSVREGTMDFINIVPRIALGVIGSGYIAAVIPSEVITGWLGVLTAVIAGAVTPGGPVVGFSLGAVALKAGGGAPQVIAYVIAWALFAFQRLLLWEIPFMPARFVWFRAAVSLPFPFLAAAIAMAIGKP